MTHSNHNAAAREAIAIPQLRAAIQGRVITPEDADYDEARTVFPGHIDRHPAVIVRVASTADVVHVVSLARETGIELAVRSGGHSGAGHGVSEGGMVLDLTGMKRLEIDVEKRTAWADTGLTAGEVTAALGEHGLAVGFGDTGSVGIGGITLGGGVGFLVRKYGMTIDDLLAAEVVTAGGQILQVDANNHPDLFWAIRGGGGNFGVATRFQFRLHQIGQIVGGMLFLPATPDNVRQFLELAEAAPEELSTIANVMTAPPMPFIPEEHHGKLIIMAFMVYAGDVEAGQKAIAPFRAIATPLADMVRPMQYPEMYPPETEVYHPVASSRSLFIDRLDQPTLERVFDSLRASTAQMAAVQIRVLGGAMARVPAEATAYAHRQRRMMVNVAAIYGSLDEKAAHEAWVTDLANVLLQGGPTDVYVNFLGDEGAARVRDAYPDSTWKRLVEIKRRYDPNNLFRLNQNIPPA